MSHTKRIIRNTAANYGQSLFALFVSLFTARWILKALGEVDMGLFGVVGSLIALITFLNGGLAISTSRFYAYSIGQAEKTESSGINQELKGWFNSALSLYLILPTIFITIGYPLGDYLIYHRLNIPPDRLEACSVVFHLSLINLFVQLTSVPFIAMYAAHHRFGTLSLFGIIRSLLYFITAYIILHIKSDRLIAYSICMVTADAGIQVIQAVRAYLIFPECRPSLPLMYHKTKLRRFFSYSGWKLFGTSCLAFRNQGSPMVINLMFGPAMNATYSIANRLSLQANTLSDALSRSFTPGIFAAEGRGDREGMLKMSMQICRYSSLLVLLFCIPMLLEAEGVFKLWLSSPPAYCADISKYLLVILIAERMTSGPMLAVNAHGKIAAYEIIQGAMFLLALPLMWLLARQGVGPVAIGLALLVSSFLQFIGRLVFSRVLLGFSVIGWSREVLLPLAMVTAPSYLLGALVTTWLPFNLGRLFLTGAVVVTSLMILSYFIVLKKSERLKVTSWISNRLRPQKIPT
jgi:O-antigen/teichoic acid export membrane protein